MTEREQRLIVSRTLDIGERMLLCGGEVSRVEDTVSRILRSYGAARVEVSKGPFEVPNSGTGRGCLFYQNANNALCLKELSGKGIWGVPFSDPICGNACAIDYYGNGRKQILFAAVSCLPRRHAHLSRLFIVQFYEK